MAEAITLPRKRTFRGLPPESKVAQTAVLSVLYALFLGGITGAFVGEVTLLSGLSEPFHSRTWPSTLEAVFIVLGGAFGVVAAGVLSIYFAMWAGKENRFCWRAPLLVAIATIGFVVLAFGLGQPVVLFALAGALVAIAIDYAITKVQRA